MNNRFKIVNVLLSVLLIIISIAVSGQEVRNAYDTDRVNLSTKTLLSIYGESINIKSVYNENEENTEVICSATTSNFGFSNFWYVLVYDKESGTYIHKWTSHIYEEKITTLEVCNIDGTQVVILGLENEMLQFYDLSTLELIKEINLPTIRDDIRNIIYADADNDGIKEIVVSTDYSVLILNSQSLDSEYYINNCGGQVRVGNVDDNEFNEIVLSSGKVYLLQDSNLTTVWEFDISTNGEIELTDVDGDSKLEIIYPHAWYQIDILDVDTKSVKYSITTKQDINALMVYDTNKDGTEEIFYADKQSGHIYCHDVSTRQLIKKIPPNNFGYGGIGGIDFADVDGDDVDELVFSSGANSTGGDNVYIYDWTTDITEWKSESIYGKYKTIAIGDVDNDKIDDIVTFTRLYSGYNITIIDGATKRVKWVNTLYSLGINSGGMSNAQIIDIDKDGLNEIVMASGYHDDRGVYVIDGQNGTLKNSYLFTGNYVGFYASDVVDIDEDNELEVLAASRSKLHVISTTDWNEEWTFNFDSYIGDPIIETCDITGNQRKEIIVCHGYLRIIDSENHTEWKCADNNFKNFDLFDYNNDDVKDIVTCTSNGEIKVLDGNTKEFLFEQTVVDGYIDYVKARLIDGVTYFIFGYKGKINYYANGNIVISSQSINNEINTFKGGAVWFDNNLLLGSSISLTEVEAQEIGCYGLNRMDISFITNNASYNNDDGQIEVFVSGGHEPYSYKWNNESTEKVISNLAPGTYSVEIRDSYNCVADDSAIVDQAIANSLDETIKSELLIYPNPAKNHIWIKIPDHDKGAYSIELIDLKGRVFKTEMVTNRSEVYLELEGLKSGIYLVKLLGKDRAYLSKVFIEAH